MEGRKVCGEDEKRRRRCVEDERERRRRCGKGMKGSERVWAKGESCTQANGG